MGGVTMVVELALLGLLGATLVYAVRLHRALGGLRREGGALAEAAAGFESGVSEAGAGLDRLRDAAAGLAVQLGQAAALKDDLVFLSQRGEVLADKLEGLVRAGQGMRPPVQAGGAGQAGLGQAGQIQAGQSQAERSLLQALGRAA